MNFNNFMIKSHERHTVSRLMDILPAYFGYNKGGHLTDAVRRNPHSVILPHEFEKANLAVFNILLQVLDEGRLTYNKGRVDNFENTIVIMFTPLMHSEKKQIVSLQIEQVKKLLSKNNLIIAVTEGALELLKQAA
jgi:ATP-dependent Clp protease ATP-binding subunit ClpB